MKIDTQTLDDHQVKLTVEVDEDLMESAKRRAAQKIAKRYKIPGFRPGKAPYQVILRHAGESVVIEEGLELLINEQYSEIISKANIDPYGPGKLENIISWEPPILEFIVPLEAVVELGDYRSIRRLYEPSEITDQDVSRVIENLRDQQAIIEPVDRAAEPGDVVTLKISANRVNPKQEEDIVLIQERSIPILVNDPNKTDEEEWPYPGFSQNLIGLSIGDEVVIKYQYSDDSLYESFRDADSEFNVKVELVRSRTLPDTNEEFLSTIGEFESIDQLKDEIRESLEEQNITSYNADYDEEIINEVIEVSTIKYPPQMLQAQIDSIINNLEINLEQQRMDLELYLKTRSITIDQLRKEAEPVAESRLKQTLVLIELAKAEEIVIDPEKLQSETQLTLASIQQQSKEKSIITEQSLENLVGNVLTSMLATQAMEKLRSIASGLLEDIETSESHEEQIDQSQSIEDITESDDSILDKDQVQLEEGIAMNIESQTDNPIQDVDTSG